MSIGEVYHASRARNINVSHTLKLRYLYSGNQLEPETQALLSFTFVLTRHQKLTVHRNGLSEKDPISKSWLLFFTPLHWMIPMRNNPCLCKLLSLNKPKHDVICVRGATKGKREHRGSVSRSTRRQHQFQLHPLV